ncbi:MAG TPA: sugar ABC transporter ATP-binding protein [Solirubrobacteraceae bacterium]|nr:sugar ABC transporter ATP-binding protein [Solirubrobacteraceae bacterium]
MTDATDGRCALRIGNLSKTFPGQRALDGVDFELNSGEVHALIGQNGSGKSTLIKVLAGFHDPDPGATVEVDGKPLELSRPEATLEAGIRFVHQDLALVPTLDTLDNLALGRGFYRAAAGTISWRREARAARELLGELGYDFDLRVPVSRLAAAERTGIAIARALQGWEGGARVLFLDEPTATLPAGDAERLFEVVRMVKRRGVAVGYVSHHFSEVFALCDRVTVLRDGQKVATRNVSEVDEPTLIELTVGRAIQRMDRRETQIATRDDVVLKVEGLSGRVLSGIDFAIHAGEVVGFAGVTGSGREEVGGLVFGAGPRGGEVTLDGKRVTPGTPTAAMASGMSMVPANRLSHGILPDMTLRENMTLGSLSNFVSTTGLNRRAEREDVHDWLGKLEVQPPRPEARIARLSGGNQQKVVIARALRRAPRVLVLDEPTQGVDVGAKASIHKIVDEVAESGACVLVSSTESEELIRLCHRIVVLDRGQIRTVLDASKTNADELTELVLGTATAAATA